MKTTPPKPAAERGVPLRARAAAPKPTGAGAPTDPPSKVDPATQALMERVEPVAGFALVRLVLADERHRELGLPVKTTALLESALVRLLALHASDDDVARDFPSGSTVFLSLEGIAPLLGTHAYLVPTDRIQGRFPTDVTARPPLGFEDTNTN